MAKLNHYKFKRNPNPAKKELGIGTATAGIQIPHCTIELHWDDFLNDQTQQWIRMLQSRMYPCGTTVIVILPMIEGDPFK